MAKNYSEPTKECLVWFWHEGDEAANDDVVAAPHPPAPVIGPPGFHLPTNASPRNPKKAVPHRPEALNKTHYNILCPSTVCTDAGEKPFGKRTIRTVREVIDFTAEHDKDLAQMPTAARIQGLKPSQVFWSGEEPHHSLKKPYHWPWQSRKFTLKHQPDATTELDEERKRSAALKHRHRTDFLSHLKKVASMKASNRKPLRKVNIPQEEDLLLHWKPSRTTPKTPVFSCLPRHPECCGHHKLDPYPSKCPCCGTLHPPQKPPTEDDGEEEPSSKGKQIPRPPPPQQKGSAPRPTTARVQHHNKGTGSDTGAPAKKDRPMSSRVRSKINDLFDEFVIKTPRRDQQEGISPRSRSSSARRQH